MGARGLRLLLIGLLLLVSQGAGAFQGWIGARSTDLPQAQLPSEARQTLSLIKQGGPYPYAQDGTVFGNREGLLPKQPRGYYREFTVPTPGLRHRGARRIVAGDGRDYWYTSDHYRSFQRIRE